MATNFTKSGANNSPQYQMSGVPFIFNDDAPALSSDPDDCLEVNFDYVTKNIFVENLHISNNLRFSFTASGSIQNGPKNYIVVSPGETVKYDFRCKSLFFMSSAGTVTPFTLVAGLTTIHASNFPVLTGSINGVSAFDGVG